MRVKGGPTDIRAVDQALDSYIVVAPLGDQFEQRASQALPRAVPATV
jgi:hypothetical protein